MAAKLLCYLIFIIVMTLIILGSVVVVILYYLPMVAIKGIAQTLSGRAAPRLPKTESSAGSQS